MADLEFVDQHNMVARLKRTYGNAEFHQIVDFLTTRPIHYALTISLTIYASYIEQLWATAKSKTVNDVKQIHATVDGKTVETGSGSGPRCQDTTLGDVGAQTSMEHPDDLMDCVPPTPYDSPLSGGHTPGSDEDLVIKKLQKKVKGLDKKQRARTLGMNRFKIGTSRRKSLDKDNVSKQGRNLKTSPMFEEGNINDDFDNINDMVDEAIDNVEGDTVNDGGAVNTATTGVSAASASVTTASVSISTAEPRTPPTTTTTAFEDKDLTIAQTLVKMRSEKAK
nr:hypothetical protein [Tanacetum cinerariifolium]